VRFVRLTAFTEAGSRGAWSSAAELSLIGDPRSGPGLPRPGWTATASDAAASYPPGNVLDGNAATIWHTTFSPHTTPLPHSLTLDLRTPRVVTGLTYLSRQDASLDGTIGRYSVTVSPDGPTWGEPVTTGTWADDKTMKTATFPAVSARYVRLTAWSEAGNRGDWTSATEVDVLGVPPNAAAGGSWAPPIGLPIVPVSAVLLPDDKLLTFAAYDAMSYGKKGTVTKVCVVDLTANTASHTASVEIGHEMFCTGLAILADGQILINGGSSDRATTLYDPATDTWTSHAGPSKQMNWVTTGGDGSVTPAGDRADSPDAMNGNAVMYDVGRILTVGGATAYQDHPPEVVNVQATAGAYTVDISRGPDAAVTTTRVSDMAYPRSFSNSVALPDGTVLVVGGQQHPQGFTDTGAVKSPELWDPATREFTVMAPDVIPRAYHSVALLLADGRVFSGGGGLCGTCTVNHPDGRIFTPPYLLEPDGSPRPRPVVTAAPSTAAPGSTIRVTVTTDVGSPTFALVRTSAVTHGVNNDQRRIPLDSTAADGSTYLLDIPADQGAVLPGPYLLFALDARGTPSVARWITIA
jgi:galactose oxidase